MLSLEIIYFKKYTYDIRFFISVKNLFKLFRRNNMITIHALGDSLVTAYGDDTNNFIGGWGDHLHSFFAPSAVKVNVYAQGGRSSRSFLNEGRFIDTGKFTVNEFPYGMGPAVNNIREGDYVFIQFCHNDDDSKNKLTYIDRMTPLGTPDADGIYPTVVPTEKMKTSTSVFPDEYPDILIKDGIGSEELSANIKKYEELLPTYGDSYYSYSCGATYKGYLKFYIDTVKGMGAYPVLITAPARQFFENGRLAAVLGHHGGIDRFGAFPYIRAVRQLGIQENVPVIDLFDYSFKLLETLGREYAVYLQSIIGHDGKTIGEARYDRPAKWVEEYDSIWESHSFGRVDDTHQNRLGSYIYAGAIALIIKKAIPELGKYVLDKSDKKMTAPKGIRSQLKIITETNPLLDII